MQNSLKRGKNRYGMTFIEIMVASVVLASAMIPVLMAFTSAHILARYVEEKTMSLNVARNQMEQIRALKLSDPDNNFDRSLSERSKASEFLPGYYCNITDRDMSAELPHTRYISVYAGRDQNNNNALEINEAEIILQTYLTLREEP
jgi:Tfp pilus assembly protein PilV